MQFLVTSCPGQGKSGEQMAAEWSSHCFTLTSQGPNFARFLHSRSCSLDAAVVGSSTVVKGIG